VKAASSVNPKDAKGLTRLAEQCGNDFQGGIVLYHGSSTLPVAKTAFLAVPFSQFWEK
jgi:hypothetical protein